MQNKTIITGLLLCLAACTHTPYAGDIQPVAQDSCNGMVPSFQNDVQPLLKTKCAKSGCHDGNSMPLDFSVYTQIKPLLDDSEVYYYAIKDRIMPEDTPLTDAAYHILKCWIINGYQDN